MAKTRFLVMDVDGTLTDGKIYMGQTGEMAKAFNIKDGCGILLELPKHNIIPIIITARESDILSNRCKELKIEECHQGVSDKLSMLQSIVARYSESLSSVAYAGDDLPDISCMLEVKRAGGLVLCPADAIPEIKGIADFVAGANAGDGAVRECINYLVLRSERETTIQERIDKAVSRILSGEFDDLSGEMWLGEDKYSVQEYMTKEEEECVLEAHRSHVDIQYMLAGREILNTYSTIGLSGLVKYDSDVDVEYWERGMLSSQSVLVPGGLIVIMNGQPHKGAIQCESSAHVKKLVCKIKV